MEEELAEILRNSFSLYETGQFVGVRRSEFLASAILAAGYAKRSDTIEECAKVCDAQAHSLFKMSNDICAKHGDDDPSVERFEMRCDGASMCATAIRNLKDKP